MPFAPAFFFRALVLVIFRSSGLSGGSIFFAFTHPFFGSAIVTTGIGAIRRKKLQTFRHDGAVFDAFKTSSQLNHLLGDAGQFEHWLRSGIGGILDWQPIRIQGSCWLVIGIIIAAVNGGSLERLLRLNE